MIRHKSLTSARISPAEAAWEMDKMDYVFHPFTEDETVGCLLHHRYDGHDGLITPAHLRVEVGLLVEVLEEAIYI